MQMAFRAVTDTLMWALTLYFLHFFALNIVVALTVFTQSLCRVSGPLNDSGNAAPDDLVCSVA